MGSLEKSRAWIEVSLNHLLHNLNEARTRLPASTKVMAVVKAMAYGHGGLEVAKLYEANGVDFFAVACLSEAIFLRENGIMSDILILGYTDLSCAELLKRYDIVQTGVNAEYVRQLDALKLGIRVHLKVDSGMHRIGENIENTDLIRELFELKHIYMEGIFSHLPVSDMPYGEYENFTLAQLKKYDALIDSLQAQGYIFKTHIQSSSGMINYETTHTHSYVRPGIMLYGVMSSTDDLRSGNVVLKPALEIKARVGAVNVLKKGESIGYGLTYKATEDMKFAVITIGYGDGIPRALSNKGRVLIHGEYARIIGRVCMDQLMVDISEIEDIKFGDIATVVGVDGKNSISLYELAQLSNSITNEILTNLSCRLPRIYE